METDKGTSFPLDLQQNRGEFFEAEMALYMFCKETIEHNEDKPRKGMAIVLKSFLLWIVLDHFMMSTHEFFEKMRSPLVKCRVGSNCLAEWGNMLDKRKKGRRLANTRL